MNRRPTGWTAPRLLLAVALTAWLAHEAAMWALWLLAYFGLLPW